MPLYFYLHEDRMFHERLGPALTASWRTRSFVPCHALCVEFEAAIRAFQETFHVGAEELLITQLARGLPFDRRYWRLLAGELLMVCAVEIPEIETSPETLTLLLEHRCLRETTWREDYAAIEQAHFGRRHLMFGAAAYRPDHAGWNDLADVRRLAEYLASIDPQRWDVADLAPALATDDERAEELDFVREWFPAFVELYQRAAQRQQIVVCEVL